MATFVEITVENFAFDLVDLIEDILSGKSEEEKLKEREAKEKAGEETEKKLSTLGRLVQEKKYKELLEQGLFKNSDKIFNASAEEIDSVCSLCFHLLPRVHASSVKDLIPRFAELLSTEPTKLPLLKLRLMTILFNMLEQSPRLRHQVFICIAKFALASGNASLLTDNLERVETWIQDWKLKDNDLSEILLLTSNLCDAAGLTTKCQDFNKKYLSSLQNSDKKTLDAAKDIAVKTILNAILDQEKTYYDDLMDLKAIQNVGTDSKTSAAFELLRIFAYENVEAYEKFYKANKSKCDALGLNHEDNLRKARRLTICSIGLEKDTVTYTELMQRLGLNDSIEVEEAIVDAVASGCVDAKMDEANETVELERCTQRTFTQEHWVLLQDKLKAWTANVKANVDSVLSTLHHVN
jgi:hypothetical protein